MERRMLPIKCALYLLMALGFLVSSASAASDGDAHPVPKRLKDQYPSAKVLAESERNEGNGNEKRYTYKITDHVNDKPFRLTFDEGGELLECEKHSRNRSEVPAELADF